MSREAARAIGASLRGVTKAFAPRSAGQPAETVVEGLTYTIEAGMFYTVFGPNAVGKTTMLSLLAGLARPDSGDVVVDGGSAGRAAIGYVFQDFRDSLFPWRSAEHNLLFPLECLTSDVGERRARLREFLATFPLTLPLSARTYELSVGQQQILAVARALVGKPQLILMDEPFSALDYRTRRIMQDWIRGYWAQTCPTVLLVTHELDEAILLGERLLLLARRPVRELEEFRVDLPRPRSRTSLLTRECFELRSRILMRFGNEGDTS